MKHDIATYRQRIHGDTNYNLELLRRGNIIRQEQQQLITSGHI